MIKGNNYFDKQEDKCSKLLYEFNEKERWFKGLTANTKGNEIDFKATDIKDRLVHIEHKQRKGTIEDYFKYGDVLIEPGKIYAFTRVMESGYTNNEQVLYINYTDDGVIIFDMNKISNMNYYPNHRQINYGKKQYEFENRFGLKMSDAIIYKYNENGNLERY